MPGTGNGSRREGARILNWEQNRRTILQLYETENKPLREVREIMRQELGFDATPRMYKTRFQAWGVRKYRVDSATNFFDGQARRLHAQVRERDYRRSRPLQAAELPHGLQELRLANHLGSSDNGDANLSYMSSSSVDLDMPSSSNDSSSQNTALSSVNHTPERSRETSRPSSSDRASLLTPGSSGSCDWPLLPSLSPFQSMATPARNQHLLENRGDLELHVYQARRASQIPRSFPNLQNEDYQSDDYRVAGEIVDQVMGFSSPSTFRTPSPAESFRDLMRAPLAGSTYQPDAFRQELGHMLSTDQDLDLPSPQPETWIKLCFYINYMLVQEQVSTAKRAMLRAATIYQSLVHAKNDQLLSILNLLLTNLFLYGKEVLAAELLSQARIAASWYLRDDDPIMVSISFMISMALKSSKSCDIKILQLRQTAEEMRTVWGQNHRFCITADYHLAWRLAMEPDLRREALFILQQTQVRAEQVFDPLHMQTVALITTQARVLGHLGHPFQAEETMSEALQRIQRWNIKDDYPYYVEARRRHKVFSQEAARVRSR